MAAAAAVFISPERFAELALEHGFVAARHQPGVYKRFNGYLRKALKRTLSAALLTVPLDEPAGQVIELDLNAAVRKCARFYDWSALDDDSD